jgi:hypothetical protein
LLVADIVGEGRNQASMEDSASVYVAIPVFCMFPESFLSNIFAASNPQSKCQSLQSLAILYHIPSKHLDYLRVNGALAPQLFDLA